MKKFLIIAGIAVAALIIIGVVTNVYLKKQKKSRSPEEHIDFIADDTTVWEAGPLEKLAANGQLAAFEHDGFWQPMDTLREKTMLEDLWQTGKAPWKVW